MMSKKVNYLDTVHHILCTSKGGTNTLENIKKLPSNIHEAYHHVFGNLTPREIIDYLNEELFTNSRYISVDKWRKKKDKEFHKEMVSNWGKKH